ncbi:MAG: TonB-dependent receptor [Tannerellaceae bacterium]|jgi:hypothetical protein|nr:TonB-dependent receptor [Tannerellaceae bacterium]
MRTYVHLFGIAFFLWVVPVEIFAQETGIRGRITDKTGEPVLAANVYLKNEPDKGTASDINGSFVLRYESRNLTRDTLIVSFLGLKTRIIPIASIDINEEISILMEDDRQMLVEVVIKANPSLSKEFSVQEISKYDIYNTPTSAGDALKMITVLPASTNVSESADPELRGSSGNMSRVILNEVPVYKPVRNSRMDGIGNFSLFNSEMIEEQNVYASNPPLIYSNATAGLVEIGTIKKLTSEETTLSLSLANIGFMHSRPLTAKGFFQIYGNYQFSNPYLWINRNDEDINKFLSEDIGFNFHAEPSKKVTVNLYSYFINEGYAANDYSYAFSGEVKAGKKRNFNILNVKYKLSNGFLSINQGTDFSEEDFEFGNILSKQKSYFIYNNLDFKYYFTSLWNIQAGFSHEYSKVDYRLRFPKYYYAISPHDPSYRFDNGVSNHNPEFYLYNRLQMIDGLTIGLGLRKNIPLKTQKGYWSYQVNLKYVMNDWNSILASLGAYNAYATPYYTLQEFTPISTKQYSLEYFFSKNDFRLQLSSYYKREHLNETFSETNTSERLLKKIQGVEIHLSKKMEVFTASFSYTYLYSKFRKDEKWYNSPNKMDYFIKAYLSYYPKKAGTFSLSFLSRPGLYYTPVIRSEANEAGIYKPLYGDYNRNKYSGYSRLDFSYNKVFTLKASHLILFLTINNLLDTKNERTVMHNDDYSSVIGYKYYNRRSFYAGVQFRF